jgi:transketolase
VLKRFEAYNWHTQYVEDGDKDLDGIYAAIEAARKVRDRPSLIKVRTTIGIGSKDQGTEKVHGNPLKPDDIASVKQSFGFDPDKFFHIPEQVMTAFSIVVMELQTCNKNVWPISPEQVVITINI